MTEQTATTKTRVTQNDVTRPDADTITGALWAIADRESEKLKRPAPRKIVTDAFMAEVKGANIATANTQYARWVKFYGVADRIKADREAEKAKEGDAAAKAKAEKAAERAKAKEAKEAEKAKAKEAKDKAKAEAEAKKAKEKAEAEKKAAAEKAAAEKAAAKETKAKK